MKLPDGFAARILDLHGEQGQSWLDRLPDLIHDLEKAWGIQVKGAFPDSNYNYVAPTVHSDTSEAVLKLTVPGEHLVNEAKSLEAYGGCGAPELLEKDLERGALLMRRVRPGTDAAELPDSQAVSAAVEVMEQLHQATIPSGHLPTVAQWGEGFGRLRKIFDGRMGPLPAALVLEAEDIFRSLTASMGSAVLLHGDLHHMNILSGGDSTWLAIDPQGVIGESAYEIGAFLRNPMPTMLDWPDLEERQRKRIKLFRKRTGVSETRIAGWGFSQAVLSAIWSLEDHGHGWEGAIQVARVLRKLIFA